MKSKAIAGLVALSAAAALAMGAGPALGAARSADAANKDDLRPLYANAADAAEGARVAQTSCAGCHGLNGVSTTEGIPNLAGQRSAYLWMELRAYKTGGRPSAPMINAVKFLSDDALLKAAAYYASLDPAQPSAAATKAAAPKPDPLQAGKAAAAACAGCHGDTGISKTPGTPSLAGLNPKYFTAALKAYKGGQRKNEVMKSFAASLSDADGANIALYYALQKRTAAPGKLGDAAAGKAAAAACTGCHGDKGDPTNADTPSLAGQDAQYLAAALAAYKDGTRADETMKGLAAGLDENATRNVASYYASLQPQISTVRKPFTTAEWVQRCDRCHGTNGNSTDPKLPALAGQRVDYLQQVLHAYRTGDRKSPQMAAMSDVLTESDVENLAAYYARQKPRAVVYVVVPQ